MKIPALIPTFNRAPFKTIEKNPLFVSTYSWFMQNGSGPVIIVEDGKSKGYTQEVVKQLKDYGEVLYFKLKEHKGPSGCRNHGMDLLLENFVFKFAMSWEDDCLFLSRDSLNVLRTQLESGKFVALIPSIHTRLIHWRKRFDILHSILGLKLKNFSSPVSRPVKVKNLCGVFLARKKLIENYRFPIVPWPNGWGEETLLALKLLKSGETIGYTSDAIVIHLKFGRRLDVRGRLPKFDYPLPLPYAKILRTSETNIKHTGCKVRKREWLKFKLAGIASAYSFKKLKLLNFQKFQNLSKLLEKKASVTFFERELKDTFLLYKECASRLLFKSLIEETISISKELAEFLKIFFVALVEQTTKRK